MKNMVCAITGFLGSFVVGAFGGWNSAMVTLIIFMGIDYVTGIILAGVFHKSSKTETGALESRAGWKGLCRKGVVLLIILVAHRIDIVVGTTYIRDAVCIAYITNEAISILENAGLMGIPIPKTIINAIEILKQKEESLNDKD